MKRKWLFFCGILIPLLAALIELVTGIGAEVLFDPFANALMIPAVLSVPVILFFYRRWRCHDDQSVASFWLAPALGWSMGISAYYVFIIGPFAFPAIIGILFGVGLIALSPLFTLLAGFLGSLRLIRNGASKVAVFLGFTVSIAFLLFVEGPSWVAVHQLSELRRNPSIAELEKTVQTLDRFGSASACRRLHTNRFQRLDPALFAIRWAIGHRSIDPQNAALAYYRLTGNSVTKPKSGNGFFQRKNSRTRWGTFDSALGGDEVSHQIEGLSLYQSLLEAEIQTDLQLVQTHWTLELKNQNPDVQEGRFHVVLPPDSFVSGLHLWVNGEPRAAAFAEKSKVTKAYRSVAVVRQRDPVLVRWAGPDRLFVQCFPVPPNGGTIKFKIEYLTELTGGTLHAPHISDRNFEIETAFRHELNYRATTNFSSSRKPIQIAKRPQGGHVLMGLLSDSELTRNSPIGNASVSEAPSQVWTENPYLTDESNNLLIRTANQIKPRSAGESDQVILLLDPSRSVKEARKNLIPILDAIPDKTILSVAVATLDGPEFVFDTAPLSETTRKEIEIFLQKFGSNGGVDNGSALQAIVEQCNPETRTKILWIHGHQPVEFNQRTKQTLLKRAAIRPNVELHSLSVRPGTNYLIQALVESPLLRSASRLSETPDAQIQRILQPVGERYQWKQVASSTTPDKKATQVESELAQQWAFLKSLKAHREGNWKKADTQLAAQHRIVTPFTGAVVLETAEQFEEFGLNPNDPAAPKTTAVPEPEFYLMLLLLILAVAAKLYHRRIVYA